MLSLSLRRRGSTYAAALLAADDPVDAVLSILFSVPAVTARHAGPFDGKLLLSVGNTRREVEFELLGCQSESHTRAALVTHLMIVVPLAVCAVHATLSHPDMSQREAWYQEHAGRLATTL